MTQTIFSSNIAGVSHAKPDFDELNAEDAVILVKEPHNPYDPNAIAVTHLIAGRLGYIPKDSTLAFHEAWANGLALKARIVSFSNEGKWPKIQLVASVEL